VKSAPGHRDFTGSPASPQLEMTGRVGSARATPTRELDAAIEAVRDKADEFARLSPKAKAVLLRECMPRLREVSNDWVEAACRAKGLEPGTPAAGEEWIGGPLITMRAARLTAGSLDAVAAAGRPPLGRGTRMRDDGRLEVDVFPASAIDAATYSGYRGSVLMQAGVDEAEARAGQASFYQREKPRGSVCAVLGAGNVAAIPPTDAFYKLFAEGRVCVVKMNPVNDYVGPFLERALAPLVRNGYLRIVYGGGEEGAHLVSHPAVDDIHITGSANTFDAIVWGPPGAERERRKRRRQPLLKKSITSELGNVSPVIVVPAAYSDKQLRFQARAVVSSVVNNASFNCNASKMLVVSRDWPQREQFSRLLVEGMAEAAPRKAYYPGARQRYEELLGGHYSVKKAGQDGADSLAWAFVPDLDPADGKEKLFTTEPFCGILSETALPEADATGFLKAATAFCNESLWGTLSAEIVAPPLPELAPAVEQAIRELHYGTVAVNVWPAISYAAMTPPWGGHPTASLEDIQSGLGWVHNTYLLDGVDKAVFKAPLVPMLKPVWHYDNRSTEVAARRLVAVEESPSWARFVGVAAAALRG
jgi:acyl-CoA reductase-like NAD-dependent aldehyde dehydrogenase